MATNIVLCTDYAHVAGCTRPGDSFFLVECPLNIKSGLKHEVTQEGTLHSICVISCPVSCVIHYSTDTDILITRAPVGLSIICCKTALVTFGHLSNLTSGWPQLTPHNLWSQQCINFQSGVLPTKFGSHRAFLSNLTLGWPQLTPAWPSTLSLHYTLVNGVLPTILLPYNIPKQFDPWLTPADPCMTFDPHHCTSLWSRVLPTYLVATQHS